MQTAIFLKRCIYFSGIMLLVAFFSCRTKKENPFISFYYWKTSFSLSNFEKNALQENNVQHLYLRYFDVDIDPGSQLAKPVSIISFDSSVSLVKNIIPVVYIKNRVWENADSSSIGDLSNNVFKLITGINEQHKLLSREVQFDCDWTEKTRQSFFTFLQQYRKISGQQLSATIRLHQVKYHQKTGIPPVDKGVLMFYNMGTIDASAKNSIYEKQNAARYVSFLKNYPLQLDIALPLFSWGIGIRGGKVRYLLNKMYEQDFEKDSNFVRLAPRRFRASHSFFKSGYYIQEADEIKVEAISEKDLTEMAGLIKKHSPQPVKQIIFYDLDSNNLVNYDSKIFQMVSRQF